MQPTPAERQRQAVLPVDLRRVINRYEPEHRRYRSVDRTQKKPRVVTEEQPKHVWGFPDAMVTIAAHAGCSVKTLYRWDKDLQTELSRWDREDSAKRGRPTQAPWRPKGARARRKRGDAYEIKPLLRLDSIHHASDPPFESDGVREEPLPPRPLKSRRPPNRTAREPNREAG
jgi:hypothetical protein